MSWRDYIPTTLKGALVAPLTPLYALGAGINELTGGSSTTWSPVAAVQGGTSSTRYSTTTQALSGYTVPPGTTPSPGSGSWGVPILNPATPRLAGELAEVVLDELGLPKLSTLVLVAAGLGAAILVSKS